MKYNVSLYYCESSKATVMLRNINHKVTMKYFVSVGKLVWQQLGGVPITGCRVAWVASSLPMPHHGDDDDENVDYIDFGRGDDDVQS